MIQEIKIKNFRSFRDEAVLSFEATKDTTFDECQVVEVAKGVRLLRFGLILGPNASGKSNIIAAMDFLHSFWFAKQDDMDQPTNAIPFLLDRDTPTEPTDMEIKFYIGEVKYWYILKLTGKRVLLEKLYCYKSQQPTVLFTRKFSDGQSTITLNSSFKVSTVVHDEISIKCLPNMSFFAARNQVNCSLPEIDTAAEWMKKGILAPINPKTTMFGYATKSMSQNPGLKKMLLNFVHKADFNITDLNIREEELEMPELIKKSIVNSAKIPKSVKQDMLANPVISSLETVFEHTVLNSRGKEQYQLPEDLQSQGTLRSIGIEAAIEKAKSKGAFLQIDEIESSLHPELVELLIYDFLKDSSRSQLLITSHYDPLLDTVDDLMRKDSVWFIDKGADGASKLYSIIEFKKLNKIRSFRKAYRNGAFGALPNINN